MECLIFSQVRQSIPISKTSIQNAVFLVLKREHRPGSISVHLIGDTAMTELNRVHRGKNRTTDVLSFAANEGKWFGPKTDELGDIFISVAQIKRQAKTWQVTAAEEFTRMLIHGTLHILGYDHIKPAEAKVMFAKQEKYLTASK